MGHNVHVDDFCLAPLAALNELRVLDLRRTNVSIVGLRQLKGLKLKVLQISDSKVTQNDLAELIRLFPGVMTNTTPLNKQKPDQDINALFAPLKP